MTVKKLLFSTDLYAKDSLPSKIMQERRDCDETIDKCGKSKSIHDTEQSRQQLKHWRECDVLSIKDISANAIFTVTGIDGESFRSPGETPQRTYSSPFPFDREIFDQGTKR